MAPVRSLSTRLVATMLVAAAIMSAAIVALVVERVDRGLARQTAAVMRLTEEKLAGRLDADARLARARLDQLADDVDRRFAAVVQSADATQAIGSQNVVAIAQALAPALALADIDGAVVLDTRARVVGASALAVDLLYANAALGGTWLAPAAVELASANDRRQPRTVRARMVLDAATAAALGTDAVGALAEIMLHPVFDEFGDVGALALGYRRLRAVEPVLTEFFNISGISIVVLSEGRRIASAGPAGDASAPIGPTWAAMLTRVDDGRFLARCVPVPAVLGARLCALAPGSELQALGLPMIAIGASQSRQLTVWLIAIVAGALVLFGAVAHLASRRVARPLVEITGAVRAVAQGDRTAAVPGTARDDGSATSHARSRS